MEQKQLISIKVEQFIEEVGSMKLTPEQSKIFHAFTKAKKEVKFEITDC